MQCALNGAISLKCRLPGDGDGKGDGEGLLTYV